MGGGAGGRGGSAQPKTRTPHKDVGNYHHHHRSNKKEKKKIPSLHDKGAKCRQAGSHLGVILLHDLEYFVSGSPEFGRQCSIDFGSFPVHTTQNGSGIKDFQIEDIQR